MQEISKFAKWAVWSGSAMLAATALLHGTGFGQVSEEAEASGLSELLAAALPGLWLFPSTHWLFLAILALVAVKIRDRLGRAILWLTAAMLWVDAAVLLVFVGPFFGEALLGLSGLAFMLGAWFARPI